MARRGSDSDAGGAGDARAPVRRPGADADPYTAEYCEPEAQTKLLYTNRAYLILPKAPDTPALYFSYQILGTEKFVQRRGQFLFDDGDDRWKLESNPEALQLFWPLRPEKKLELERVDRTNGAHAHVTFVVLGLEPIEVNRRPLQELEDPPARPDRGRQEHRPVPLVRAAALHSLGLHGLAAPHGAAAARAEARRRRLRPQARAQEASPLLRRQGRAGEVGAISPSPSCNS